MDKAKFFAAVRSSLFGGSLSQDQVDGTEAILDAYTASGLTSGKWLAYMLATAFHETARTMQPIEEYGKGKGRPYGRPAGPYSQAYYGRGLVQLTWQQNYQKAKDELGVDFVQHPELALDPTNAANIMIKGMAEGWFTGKKLEDYFDDDTSDWVNARRIINGLDKAQAIAGYGKSFFAAIEAAAE
jgi:hypothetical protein